MSNTKSKVKSQSKAETISQTNTNPQVSPQTNTNPQLYSKSDFIHAKAIIAAYKEQNKNKPKRTCTEKQLPIFKQSI